MLRTNLVYICFWLAILAGAAPKPADGSSPSAPQPGDPQDSHSKHLGSLQVARPRDVVVQQHSVPRRHASPSPAPQAVATVQLQQRVAGSPVGRRPRSLPNFHMTRTMALLGMINPITRPNDSSPKQDGSANSSHQHQQQHQQYTQIRIQAELRPVALQQHGHQPPLPAESATKHTTSAVACHTIRRSSKPAGLEPIKFAMLLPLLPSHTSGKSQAAYDAAEHSGAGLPMLLSVHVEQRLDGRAYLWTSSNLVLPGSASVSIQANMSDCKYSWPLPRPKQDEVHTAAAAQQSTNTAAALQVDRPSINISSAAAAGHESYLSHSTNEQQACSNGSSSSSSSELQQGPSVSAAASICPAVQEQLSTCAAEDAASTAYAVASMLDNHPAHAAWIAALTAENNAAQLLLLKQQQQQTAGSMQNEPSDSSPSSHSDRDDTCPAWPAEYHLQGVLVQAAAGQTHTTPAAAAAAATTATNAAEQRSSGAVDSITALWAAVRPYLEPYVTIDQSSGSVIIHASIEHIVLGLLALLSSTAAAAGLLCRRSSARQSAVIATHPAASIKAPAQDCMPQELLDGPAAEDSTNYLKRHSSKQSNRDQDDLVLFGRSALDQLGQQQLLDSFEDVDQDDDLFGYTGAAAAAPMPAQQATATSAVVQAVRKASTQAAATVKSALGANKAPQGAAAAGTGLLSPAGGARKAVNAAAAINNTAAKLAAGYWDTADEDAVNKLPASIQERLQAGGLWTRDAGGRLMRGSVRALRAASTVAAAAVAAAVSGGARQQQQQHGGIGEGNSDAELLRRLVAAGPGAELALSDEE